MPANVEERLNLRKDAWKEWILLEMLYKGSVSLKMPVITGGSENRFKIHQNKAPVLSIQNVAR